MKSEEYTCVCGAKYEITAFHIPLRDKDMIECEFCHRIIKKWNGSTMYSATLIEKKVLPEDEIRLDKLFKKAENL